MKSLSTKFCNKCDLPMIYVDHWEPDGDQGSHEPYWECPDGCDQEDLDYYTPPSQAIFNDVKHACIQIWQSYDDTYGYATEKINQIKDIQNISDNCLFMVNMFDVHNMRKLQKLVTEESKEWLEPFLQEHFRAEQKLKDMGIEL